MSRGNAPMTSSSNDGMNSATSSANHGMDTSDIPLTSSANETQTAIADQASLPESSQLENKAYIPDSDAARMDVAHALLELSQTTYVSHVDQCTQTEELTVDKDDKETQTPDFNVDALKKGKCLSKKKTKLLYYIMFIIIYFKVKSVKNIILLGNYGIQTC